MEADNYQEEHTGGAEEEAYEESDVRLILFWVYICEIVYCMKFFRIYFVITILYIVRVSLNGFS